MSRRSDDTSKALSKRPASDKYEVGYGKPPVETRFKSGQSGNPHGRPRGSKNRSRLPALHEERLKAIILEEAYRTISVNDASGAVSIPMAQAVVRSLAVNAAKGNQRAQRLFTQLLGQTEQANRHLHNAWLEQAIEYKVEWERELERRKKLGIVAPDPIPHPDDIVIDMRTGTVQVKGPMTKEEKVVWDQFRKRKDACDADIDRLRNMLDDPKCRYRNEVEQDLEHQLRIRELIAQVILD